MINPFLTDIAKEHVPELEYVLICDLEEEQLWGQVQRKGTENAYRILINEKTMTCPHRALFTAFHEIGHILAGHLGDLKRSKNLLVKEFEADHWAFHRMGMFDERGVFKNDCVSCGQCLLSRLIGCLKAEPENHE